MEKFGEIPFEQNAGDGLNVTRENGLPHGREPLFPDKANIPRPQNDIMNPALATAKKAALLADCKRAEAIKKRLEEEQKQKKSLAEKQPLNWQERERKLNDNFKKIVCKQKSAGFPVDIDDGRINIYDFEGISNFDQSVIKSDKEMIERLDYAFKADGEKEKQSSGIGEKSEKLVSVLFSKLLPDCNILRASKIDDEYDKSDKIDSMLLIDGKVVCAFDVAADFSQEKRINEKEKKVSMQNRGGGVKIKYCFEERGDKIIYKPETNIPAFNIKIDPDLFDKIKFSSKKFERPEMQLMCNVLVSVYKQIEELEELLQEGNIKFDPEFGNQDIFAERLEALKDKLSDKISKDRAQKYLDEQETRGNHGDKI